MLVTSFVSFLSTGDVERAASCGFGEQPRRIGGCHFGHDPDLVQKHFFSSFAFYSFGSNLPVIKNRTAGARSSGESI